MDYSTLDADQPAKLHWVDVPDGHGQTDGVFYKGQTRRFDTVREAVAFWGSLSEAKRLTAKMERATGPDIDAAGLRFLHDAARS